jgi:uncharacterized tellurite resistance protein B-like protein
MEGKIFKFITNQLGRLGVSRQASTHSDPETARTIAALFRQLALADGVVKLDEINSGMDALVRYYPDLLTDKTGQHIVAQIEHGDGESIFPLIKILKKNLSDEQFKLLKEQLIAVAKSDQEYHPKERDFIEWVDEIYNNL